MTLLIILCVVLAVASIGLVLMLVLLYLFPTPAPKWPEYPEIEIAKVPVIEAGSVSYQWINLTGLEDESQ